MEETVSILFYWKTQSCFLAWKGQGDTTQWQWAGMKVMCLAVLLYSEAISCELKLGLELELEFGGTEKIP